jgi:hypothetical protein
MQNQQTKNNEDELCTNHKHGSLYLLLGFKMHEEQIRHLSN